VNLLLDTHLLLRAAGEPKRLSRAARRMIEDGENELYFSAASLWEVAINSRIGRGDFRADVRVLRRSLLDNNYREVQISSEHTVATVDLAPIHKDPFDRVLIAQARCEGVTLLATDPWVAQYAGPIKKV